MNPQRISVALIVIALNAQLAAQDRIVRDLPSVLTVCSENIVISHESNEILFDMVDQFHNELLGQFRRLVKQVTSVRFVYLGQPTGSKVPVAFDSVISPELAARSCDATLDAKAEISFLGTDRYAVTTSIGLRRNALPGESSLSNAERRILDLWRKNLKTEPFGPGTLRIVAHREALALADDFSTAHR